MKYLLSAFVVIFLGAGVAVSEQLQPVGSVSESFCKDPKKPCNTYVIHLGK